MAEANKDEALRALDISKKKFADGSTDAALKFCNKSLALCETEEGKSWLQFLNSYGRGGSANGEGSSASNTSSPSQPGLRQRPTSSATGSSEGSSTAEPTERPYTPEQAEGIKRIKACKVKGDLYAILGVEKGCTDSDIKKAYKKLALQFHPDKCAAPGTDEAFKAIGHAMAVLSDAEKREKYDRYGVDPENRAATAAAASPSFRQSPFAGDFENEISPEDLFKMFFGDLGPNGFTTTFSTGNGVRFRTTRAPRQQTTEPASGIQQFLRILPILLVMLFSIISWISSDNDPTYSFNRVGPYSSEKLTSRLNIPYFVNDNQFTQMHYDTNAAKLKNFENTVERRFLDELDSQCHRERQIQNYKRQAAMGLFSVDQDRMREANSMRLYSCEQREELLRKLNARSTGSRRRP